MPTAYRSFAGNFVNSINRVAKEDHGLDESIDLL